MLKARRIRRAVVAIHNTANDALVKATIAAYLDKVRRNGNTCAASAAVVDIEKNWSTILSSISSHDRGYSLYLAWMVEGFAKIVQTVELVEVEKATEARRQGLKSATVFENHLDEIVKLIENPFSGISYCYHKCLEDPAKVDLDIMMSLGLARAGAKRIRRIIFVMKIPLLRWLLLEAHPVWLLVWSFIIFFVAYTLSAVVSNGSADLPSIRSSMVADQIAVKNIWSAAGTGVWSKLATTASLLGDATILGPIFLALVAALLYPVRRMLQLSGVNTAKIETTQKFLIKFSKQFGVKRSFFNIQEVNMGDNNKITRIGSISPGAIVNINGYMENVTANVQHNLGQSTQSDDTKSLVEQLAKKIADVAPRIDAETAEKLGADLESLSKEMVLATPRKRSYQVFLEGLQETAQTAGKIAMPIVELVKQISPLLLN